MTDHAEAAALVLERYAALIRAGRNVEDLAHELLLIVRIMARKT